MKVELGNFINEIFSSFLLPKQGCISIGSAWKSYSLKSDLSTVHHIGCKVSFSQRQRSMHVNGLGFLRFRFLPVESWQFGDPSIPGTETQISDSIVKWNRLEPKAWKISFFTTTSTNKSGIWLIHFTMHDLHLMYAIDAQNMQVSFKLRKNWHVMSSWPVIE